MSVVAAGMLILVIFWQLLKADCSIFVTDTGRSMLSSPVFWNAPPPMVVICAGVSKVTLVIAEQPLKAPFSIVVTVVGTLNVASFVSPLKAFCPMLVRTVEPMNRNDSREVHPEKADPPMAVSLELPSTVTVFRLLQPLKAAAPKVSIEAGSSSFSSPELTNAQVPIFLNRDVGWNTSSFSALVYWKASFSISSKAALRVSLVSLAALLKAEFLMTFVVDKVVYSPVLPAGNAISSVPAVL